VLQVVGVGLVWLFVRYEPRLSQPLWGKAEACIERCIRPLWARTGVSA
jgi:hypothetical protein